MNRNPPTYNELVNNDSIGFNIEPPSYSWLEQNNSLFTQSNGIPMLKPYPNFNAEEDVEILKKAFKKKSKKELVLLCNRTAAQRAEISELFYLTTNKRMISLMKSSFRIFSNFRLLMIGFTIPYHEYLARCINYTKSNFKWMNYLLFTISYNDMKLMKDYFRFKYKTEVRDYVHNLMKSDDHICNVYKNTIRSLLTIQRNYNSTIEENLIIKDIQRLNDFKRLCAMEKYAGTEEVGVLNEIFLTRNFQHIKIISERFLQQNNQDLVKFLEKFAPCHELYQNIVKYSLDCVSYFAFLLFKSFNKITFRANMINHVFITRAEIDLYSIKMKYKEQYGEDLSSNIKKLSENYQRALLEIYKDDEQTEHY